MTSQTSEYALRAVVWLASRPEKALNTGQISTVTKVPAGYLSKVLQALARGGLVISTSGRGGGFLLARAATDISVLDVINAVDGVQRIRQCPLGIRSHGSVLCPLHKRLDDAMAMVEKAFANSTIAELIAEPSASTPLCEKSAFVKLGTVAAPWKRQLTPTTRSTAKMGKKRAKDRSQS